MGGCRAADGLEQRQRMRSALVLLEQHLVGEFERGETADARADDAGGAIGRAVLERDLQLRHGDGFLRRAAGILRVLVGKHERLALQPLFRIEVRHFTRDGDVQILGRKALNLAYAALALFERRPKLVYACAQRSDDAVAGDHDAPAPVSVCHVALSRNSQAWSTSREGPRAEM